MGYLLFILLNLLIISLLLSVIKNGKWKRFAVAFRTSTIVFGIGFFTYWFAQKSMDKFMKDAMAVQIINELPQPLDFYIITVERRAEEKIYKTRHIGKVRMDHYRLDYLKMSKSNEFWLVGYIGKNVSYFTRQFVPNKNIDQIITINNYTIEDESILDIAKEYIDVYKQSDVRYSVWISMALLLLFINIGLFVKIPE